MQACRRNAIVAVHNRPWQSWAVADPLDASVDDTFVDRTWMAYSRTILLALAVGVLLVRGAFLRDLPVWLCAAVAVPALVLTVAFIHRMRRLSLGHLATPANSVILVAALVGGSALLGGLIAMMG